MVFNEQYIDTFSTENPLLNRSIRLPITGKEFLNPLLEEQSSTVLPDMSP